MRIKGLRDEDFVNYKKPSLFIGSIVCDWKCCNEQCLDKSVCQNSSLATSKIINMSTDEIFRRYINNSITKAIVIGGLEPFLQFEEVVNLVDHFRVNKCNDDFVIYTGYYRDEIIKQIDCLQQYENVIVKFGRYIPGHEKHYDDALGVYLASNNQYAEKIS